MALLLDHSVEIQLLFWSFLFLYNGRPGLNLMSTANPIDHAEEPRGKDMRTYTRRCTWWSSVGPRREAMLIGASSPEVTMQRIGYVRPGRNQCVVLRISRGQFWRNGCRLCESSIGRRRPLE